MNKTDWEQAARAQLIRAERAEEQREDYHHAINILMNDAVDWFFTYREPNGDERKFGIGIAMDVPITESILPPVTPGQTENRAVIVWMTSGMIPERGREHKYITVLSLRDFRDTPRTLREAEPVASAHLVEVVEQAIPLVDEAERKYLYARRGPKPVTQ